MVIIAMDRLYVMLGMTGKLQMMVGDSLEAFPIGAVYMSSKSTSPPRVFARLMDTDKRSCTDWCWRGISRWSDWRQDISHMHGNGNDRNGSLMAAIDPTAGTNMM